MISVVVPYRSDSAQRSHNWAWIGARWRARHPDFQVIVADSCEEPFNRSASINMGVDMAFGDVLVIADADTVVSNLEEAVRVAIGDQWVIAYGEDAYYTLQPEATDRLLFTDPAAALADPSELGWSDPDRVTSVSGTLVMRRSAFWAAGGFDERFQGWGGEDRAFVIALEQSCGPMTRVPGYALHLWHPRGLDFKAPEWPANASLLERYREWQLGTPGFGDPRVPARG